MNCVYPCDVLHLKSSISLLTGCWHFPEARECWVIDSSNWAKPHWFAWSWEVVMKSLHSSVIYFHYIMARHWPGDKPLSEAMIVSLLMHICVTRPQWVKAANIANSPIRHRFQTSTLDKCIIDFNWRVFAISISIHCSDNKIVKCFKGGS